MGNSIADSGTRQGGVAEVEGSGEAVNSPDVEGGEGGEAGQRGGQRSSTLRAQLVVPDEGEEGGGEWGHGGQERRGGAASGWVRA